MADLDSEYRYDYQLDMKNDNSSHVKLMKMVGTDKDVLEIGPATGYLTRYMKEELMCRVTAVEIDEEAAKIAEQYTENLIVGDIEEIDLSDLLSEKVFDVIVFAVILEHLKNTYMSK